MPPRRGPAAVRVIAIAMCYALGCRVIPANGGTSSTGAPQYCQRTSVTPTAAVDRVLGPITTSDGPAAEGPAADLGIADMDGDGRLDIVIARGAPHGVGNISVLYARQDGWHRWVSKSELVSYADLEIAD